MEHFYQFTITQPSQIVGGRLITTYCRFEACDIYDTEMDRTVYIE